MSVSRPSPHRVNMAATAPIMSFPPQVSSIPQCREQAVESHRKEPFLLEYFFTFREQNSFPETLQKTSPYTWVTCPP